MPELFLATVLKISVVVSIIVLLLRLTSNTFRKFFVAKWRY